MQPSKQKKPNIIWFFCDQLRAQAFGYRGDPNVFTPNIDNFAREAVRFDNAVAGAPWCCPFRGALFTGMYPHQNGVTRTPSPLDPALPTVVQPLKSAGYQTFYVGKWHLDGSNGNHIIPPERRGGYDYWMGYENQNNQNEAYIYGSEHEEPRRLPGHETPALMDLFLRRLEYQSKEEDPFFGVLSIQPPHSPYVSEYMPEGPRVARNPASIHLRRNVPPVPWVEDKARLDLNGYYEMIEAIDRELGRLRQTLQRLDLDRDTYLFFFSDHGDMLGSHAQWEKSSPWEESIRIPLLIGKVGAGVNCRGGRRQAVFNHVDFAPTTLGLCGLAPPESMVGFDYSRQIIHRKDAHFKGEPEETSEPESAFLQQIPRKFHPHSVNKAWRGLVTRDGWKYVCQPGHDWLLHNLNDDPFELANLAHDQAFAPQRERCHRLLDKWIQETEDDFALPELKTRDGPPLAPPS